MMDRKLDLNLAKVSAQSELRERPDALRLCMIGRADCLSTQIQSLSDIKS